MGTCLPKQKDLRVTVLSDTYGFHKRINLEGGDVLIHCGNFTRFGLYDEIYDFVTWFAKQPYKYKIFVPGPNEISLDPYKKPQTLQMVQAQNFVENHPDVIYLFERKVTIDKMVFYGLPYTAVGTYVVTPMLKRLGKRHSSSEDIPFDNIAFPNFNSQFAKRILNRIPKGIDVLITNCPPKDIMDLKYKSVRDKDDWRVKSFVNKEPILKSTGCSVLKEYVFKLHPKYMFFGNAGYINQRDEVMSRGINKISGITFINACNLIDAVVLQPIHTEIHR